MATYPERMHTLITTALTFYSDERGIDQWLEVLTDALITADKPDQCDRCAAAGDCSPRYPFMRGKGEGVWRYLCYRCDHQWQCSWGFDVLPITLVHDRNVSVPW